MKIACIMSGQPRHLDKGLDELRNLLDGIEVDFFVHTWIDDSDLGKVFNSANPNDISVWSINKNTGDLILKTLDPKRYLFEKQIEFKPKRNYESRTLTHQKPWQFMSMTYSRKKSFELLESYIDETKTVYDFVISTRSDIRYHNKLKEYIEKCDPRTFYTLFVPGPMWNDDIINDPLVLSSFDNIKQYCSLFDDFDKHWMSGISFCPHRLLMAQMKDVDEIKFDTILEENQWSYIRT